MYSKVEVITPQLAEIYLSRNIKNNRKIKRGNVDTFAADMKKGEWQLTSQGITFNESGELTDGQHRLAAIVKADVPVQMYVTYGEPNSSTIHDRGRARSLLDVHNMSCHGEQAASRAMISIVNSLFNFASAGDHAEATPDSSKLKFLEAHWSMLAEAESVTKQGAQCALARTAPVGSAAFCARFCGVGTEDLTLFFKILNSGFQDSASQSAAIVARQFITSGWVKEFQTYTFAARRRVFDVTSLAIRDFVSEAARKRVYSKEQKSCYFEPVREEILKYL